MFDIALTWDRPARTGPRPTRHILSVRISPRQSIDVGGGLPVSMAIALDLSGSMAGDKFVKAAEACRRIVQMLRPQDRLWLCGFATDLIPVLNGVPGGPDGVAAAIDALRRMRPGGVTRTELGLEWALQSLSTRSQDTKLAVLITDGHATDPRGKPVEDTSGLAAIADRFGAAGINLSTVGLGDAALFNTAFLVSIADRGKGAFIYADTPARLTDALVSRLSTAQSVGAASSCIDIATAPGVQIAAVCRIRPGFVPLEGVNEPGGYHVELGALRSDTTTDILFDFESPVPASADSYRVGDVRLTSGDQTASATASLTNTASYTAAQSRNADVDKDRLNWELNLLTTELTAAPDPRKTGSLLETIQRTAVKAGDTQLAETVAEQIVDLRKTGKLTPHRTTGLLTAARGVGD